MISILEQVNAIDIQSKDGDTLLMVAARNGLTDVVYELLNLNATITVSKDTITAASKLANEAGFHEVVEILRNATVKVTTYSYSNFSVFVFLFIYLSIRHMLCYVGMSIIKLHFCQI